MSGPGITEALMAAAAEMDAEAARRRGTTDLVDRVIDARFACSLDDTERFLALGNVYLELIRPDGGALTEEAKGRIEALLAGGPGGR